MFCFKQKRKFNNNKLFYTILVADVNGGKNFAKLTVYSKEIPKQLDENMIEIDGARIVFEEPVRIY